MRSGSSMSTHLLQRSSIAFVRSRSVRVLRPSSVSGDCHRYFTALASWARLYPSAIPPICVFQRAIRDETYISTEDADNIWFTPSPSNPVRLCFCRQGCRPRSRTSSFRKRINFPLQRASPSISVLVNDLYIRKHIAAVRDGISLLNNLPRKTRGSIACQVMLSI
jgi:hypothetical protein